MVDNCESVYTGAEISSTTVKAVRLVKKLRGQANFSEKTEHLKGGWCPAKRRLDRLGLQRNPESKKPYSEIKY